MSNERSEPNYNLRKRRVTAGVSPYTLSEGFIRASEVVRRAEELRLGGVHEETKSEEAASQELVSHLSPSDNDEGGGTSATQGAATTDTVGDQGCVDLVGDTQGQQQTPPHSPLVEEATQHNQPQLLRLRVRVWDKRAHRFYYQIVSVNTMI